MKFGEVFTEYLLEERERLFDKKIVHIEYKRFKKVLKRCKSCKESCSHSDSQLSDDQLCQCQACPCKCYPPYSYLILGIHLFHKNDVFDMRISRLIGTDRTERLGKTQ